VAAMVAGLASKIKAEDDTSLSLISECQGRREGQYKQNTLTTNQRTRKPDKNWTEHEVGRPHCDIHEPIL